MLLRRPQRFKTGFRTFVLTDSKTKSTLSHHCLIVLKLWWRWGKPIDEIGLVLYVISLEKFKVTAFSLGSLAWGPLQAPLWGPLTTTETMLWAVRWKKKTVYLLLVKIIWFFGGGRGIFSEPANFGTDFLSFRCATLFLLQSRGFISSAVTADLGNSNQVMHVRGVKEETLGCTQMLGDDGVTTVDATSMQAVFNVNLHHYCHIYFKGTTPTPIHPYLICWLNPFCTLESCILSSSCFVVSQAPQRHDRPHPLRSVTQVRYDLININLPAVRVARYSVRSRIAEHICSHYSITVSRYCLLWDQKTPKMEVKCGKVRRSDFEQ